MRSIEHGILNDDDSIKMMSEKGTYLVPTLICYKLMTSEALPELTRNVAMRAVVDHEKTIKMAKKAGVNIAMGTDCGYPTGSLLGKCQAQELELFATISLKEMEAIVAANKTAAECLGIGDTTGTIEPDKLADLIIVEGNPIKDIKILQNLSLIKKVMK